MHLIRPLQYCLPILIGHSVLACVGSGTMQVSPPYALAAPMQSGSMTASESEIVHLLEEAGFIVYEGPEKAERERSFGIRLEGPEDFESRGGITLYADMEHNESCGSFSVGCKEFDIIAIAFHREPSTMTLTAWTARRPNALDQYYLRRGREELRAIADSAVALVRAVPRK